MGEYKYNSSVISNYAKELRKWAEQEDSIILLDFMNPRGLLYDYLYDFKRKSTEFSDALRYAKQCISSRLHKKLARNEINASYYHRIIRMYDSQLERQENDDKELDYKLTAKYAVQENQNPLTVNVINYKDAVKTAKANIESKHKARWKDDRTNSDS